MRRQRVGQQPALEGRRDVGALAVQARVLDRGAGAAAELLGELQVGALNARPDSALTNVITPIARPRLSIGTTITARIPMSAPARAARGRVIVREQLVVDVVDQQRGPAPAPARRRAREARRVALLVLVGERELGRVDVDEGDAAQVVAVAAG